MRSQVTVYVILGLLLVLTVGIIIYTARQVTISPFEKEIKEYAITTDVMPLKRYIERCLTDMTREAVAILSKHGGVLTPQRFIEVNGTPVQFWCYQEPGHGCVQNYQRLQDIETEINDYIERQLDQCINMDIFRRQGFNITVQQKRARVTIAPTEIHGTLHYPISLDKNQLHLTAEDFSITFANPFGSLYALGIHIVNEENTQGFFDHLAWMKKHNSHLIEKIKQYPHTIYKLTQEKNEFFFALEGEDTVSQVGQRRFGEITNEYGCCYNSYDNSCYKNTPQEVCLQKDGLYEQRTNCVCPAFEEPEEVFCNNKPCKHCTSLKKQHGESWCSYDGPTDNGNDFVGSRQYLHYCLDGTEYVEPCRDYREELCTEEQGITTRAACRANRWQDCSVCTTEACCSDAQQRDCVWSAESSIKRCVPRVKPGFRFWGGNGATVCARGTQKKECSGFSCSQEWLDDTARLCYQQGDCGNYFNVIGMQSKRGYFETDFVKDVSEEIYPPPEKNGLTIDPTARTQGMLMPSEVSYLQTTNQYAELVQSIFSYFDSLTTLSISEVLNPLEHAPIKVMDIAYCGLWQAPLSGDCKKCRGLLSCSEYACRSIGQNCVFNNGQCAEKISTDVHGPHIEVHAEVPYQGRPKQLQVEDTLYPGVEIIPSIQPYSPITIRVRTDEPTRCKLAFTPLPSFEDLPSYYLSEGFTTNHTLTLRMPERMTVPKKILDTLNVSTLHEAVSLVQKPVELISQFTDRYKTSIRVAKTLGSTTSLEQLEYYRGQFLGLVAAINKKIPDYEALMELLVNKFEQNGMYLFVKCSDASNNENAEDFFVELSIADLRNDSVPPSIIATSPADGMVTSSAHEQDFTLYTNEPAVCKYSFQNNSFEEMEHVLLCSTSPFDMHAIGGGSYPCSGNIIMDSPAKSLYVRCKDHPRRQSIWQLHLKQGPPQVEGADRLFVNVSDREIHARAKALQDDVGISIPRTQVQLNLYLDDDLNCVIANKSLPCSQTSEVNKGLYRCVQNISLPVKEQFFTLTIAHGSVSLVPGMRWNNTLLDINSIQNAQLNISLNATPINVRLHFNDLVKCSISDRGMLTQLPCIMKGEEYLCGATLDYGSTTIACERPWSEQTVPIICQDREPLQQNTNRDSFVYALTKSKPLEIIDYEPRARVEGDSIPLRIVLNEENAHCGYYTDRSVTPLALSKVNATFTAVVDETNSGWLSYWVICKDTYGNTVEKELKFWKE